MSCPDMSRSWPWPASVIAIRSLSERECFLRLAAIKLGRERTVHLYPDAAGLFEP